MENILSDWQGFDCLNIISNETVKAKNGNRLQRSKLRAK